MLFHMLKVVLGHEQRLSNTTDPTLIPAGYLESLGPQVYWTVNLYITRFLYTFAPYEVIHSADALVKEMHKDVATSSTTTSTSARISSPIDIYSLSLAVLTLLEASKLPLCAEFCWKILGNIEQILDRRAQASSDEFEGLFSTPAWDRQLRAWIDAEKDSSSHLNLNQNQNQSQSQQTAESDLAAVDRQESTTNPNPNHPAAAGGVNPPSNTNTNTNATANANPNQPPLVGPNEQRSLQHLADLAVGAEGSGTTSGSGNEHTLPVPGGSSSAAAGTVGGGAVASDDAPGTNANPAENGNNSNNNNNSTVSSTVDFSVALRRGFMNVLSLAAGSRH